jgi:predicted dehydrogenase
MLNAAIIGLGWWGQRLVQSVDGSRLIRFSRGVSLEPDTVRSFGFQHGLSVDKSYEDVLADRMIDTVVLATPHTRHRTHVEAAAAARKHVFCEKPFALSRSDAEAALAACRRAEVTVGVGHHFRLMPSMVALRELVTSGALGTVMHVEGNYSHDWLANQPLAHWRTAKEESRAGGMTGMGIHVLDAFAYLFGPMRRVSALSKQRTLRMPAGDTTAALIEFSSGVTATLATTLKTPFIWRIAVHGSDARAESVSETRLIAQRPGQEAEVKDFPSNNHLGMNLENFAAAALGQREFPIDHAGIVHTVAALEAVFRSVDANGAWQAV